MWRLWNNISRAFRTHLSSLRPSAGVLVEEDQELLEKCDSAVQGSCTLIEHVNNKESNLRDEHCYCNETYSTERGKRERINGGENKEREKTFQHHFWHHNMFEAVKWGHVFMWGSDRENFKRRSSSSLLYQILFSLSGRSGSTVRPVLPTIKEEPQPKQLAIKDAAGAAFDQKINVSKTETLELAMQEYKKVCHEYSACSESLLGLKAADKGDMPAAVEHLQRSCLLGNMSACFNLGLCYETGSGVPQDEAKAAYYYQKAAKAGHKMALYNLGLMCLRQGDETSHGGDVKGKAARKDKEDPGLSKEMGLDFLEEAARLGLPEAQTYLGLYIIDECQEPSRAVSYFKAAAGQNDSEAQYLLAMCYEQGLGVDTNECLAARFYSLAAQTGHGLALYNLGVFNEEGLGGLPKNEAAALEMYRKAAKLGSVEAEERLGEILDYDDSDSAATHSCTESRSSEGSEFEFSERQDLAEKQETSPTYDNTAIEQTFLSLLSPSASFPSLRSLSSLTLPKPEMKLLRTASHQGLDSKVMVQDPDHSFRVTTDKTGGFLGKVNFFLDMTLDHDLDIPFGSLSKSLSSRTIPVSPFGPVEIEDSMISSLHRSHTFSDFSMIGI